MNIGYIKVQVVSSTNKKKISQGKINIYKSKSGENIYRQYINKSFSGETKPIPVETPSKELSQHPLPPGILPYEPYDVTVQVIGYIDTIVRGVQAFPDVTAIQRITMYPLPPGAKQGSITNIIVIPPPTLLLP